MIGNRWQKETFVYWFNVRKVSSASPSMPKYPCRLISGLITTTRLNPSLVVTRLASPVSGVWCRVTAREMTQRDDGGCSGDRGANAQPSRSLTIRTWYIYSSAALTARSVHTINFFARLCPYPLLVTLFGHSWLLPCYHLFTPSFNHSCVQNQL